MRTWILSTAAVGLFAISGAANAVVCTNNGITVDVDGTSACAGPVGGNVPPYNLNDPADSPDMGLGFTDWTSIEKDNIGQGGEDDGLLQITLSADNEGTWRYTGTDGYGTLLLVVKFGNDFATFLVNGTEGTWYDWLITPAQANGLSHMELFGRGTTSVPEPTSLALLGLGLAGLGFARRRRSK